MPEHREAWCQFDIHDDAGVKLGELSWNAACTNLNAHCRDVVHCAGRGKCHMDKTLNVGRKRGQGRPVGLLVLWLRRGAATLKDHRDLKCDLGSAIHFAERKRARDWLKTQPGSEVVFALELLAMSVAKDAGEDSEPEVIT